MLRIVGSGIGQPVRTSERHYKRLDQRRYAPAESLGRKCRRNAYRQTARSLRTLCRDSRCGERCHHGIESFFNRTPHPRLKSSGRENQPLMRRKLPKRLLRENATRHGKMDFGRSLGGKRIDIEGKKK